MCVNRTVTMSRENKPLTSWNLKEQRVALASHCRPSQIRPETDSRAGRR